MSVPTGCIASDRGRVVRTHTIPNLCGARVVRRHTLPLERVVVKVRMRRFHITELQTASATAYAAALATCAHLLDGAVPTPSAGTEFATNSTTFTSLDRESFLRLHALRRQVQDGPCTQNAPLFFLREDVKACFLAWTSLGDLASDAARQQFVRLVAALRSQPPAPPNAASLPQTHGAPLTCGAGGPATLDSLAAAVKAIEARLDRLEAERPGQATAQTELDRAAQERLVGFEPPESERRDAQRPVSGDQASAQNVQDTPAQQEIVVRLVQASERVRAEQVDSYAQRLIRLERLEAERAATPKPGATALAQLAREALDSAATSTNDAHNADEPYAEEPSRSVSRSASSRAPSRGTSWQHWSGQRHARASGAHELHEMMWEAPLALASIQWSGHWAAVVYTCGASAPPNAIDLRA
jgi:acyl-CoA-binding protein